MARTKISKNYKNFPLLEPELQEKNIEKYFDELNKVLTQNKIIDKPQKIFSIDESVVTSLHSPPLIVCRKDTVPQCVTFARSLTITVIAAGNAAGQSVPQYYVFPGQRWNDELFKNACPG